MESINFLQFYCTQLANALLCWLVFSIYQLREENGFSTKLLRKVLVEVNNRELEGQTIISCKRLVG